jgi:hypothetical protein
VLLFSIPSLKMPVAGETKMKELEKDPSLPVGCPCASISLT